MSLAPSGEYNIRQVRILAVNCTLVVLSVAAVALRFWARKIQRVTYFADDWLILLALCLALGVNAVSYYGIHVGVGVHISALNGPVIEGFILNLYIIQILWNTALPVIKLSILLFVKRIFTNRTMKYPCYGLMLFIAMWYVAFQATAIFQCQPIHHRWQRSTTEGTCIDWLPFIITLASTNLATDVALLVLPVRDIWKLQMRKAQKMGLYVTFTIGIIICVISAYRIACLVNIKVNGDVTYTDAYPRIWTAVESSLGVVVACIPHLMPIFRKMRRRDSRLDPFGRRSSRPAPLPMPLTDFHNLRRPRSTYKISGPLHLSQSEIDKDEKDAEDDIDLHELPTNSIAVKTEMDIRSEPLSTELFKTERSREFVVHAL